MREIGARAAFNHAQETALPYVVIDIADDHALEVSAEEFQPLLSAAARRDSSGPYAARGRVSSSIIEAVKSSPPPPMNGGMRPTPPPGSVAAALPPSRRPLSGNGTTGTNPGRPAPSGPPPAAADDAVRFTAPPTTADDVYDRFTTSLRPYPEVEWAALCTANREGLPSSLCVALRIDPSFRQRLEELAGEVRQAAVDNNLTVEILLLDSPASMRAARRDGVVFYPWRK
jgi:hypothetical protein